MQRISILLAILFLALPNVVCAQQGLSQQGHSVEAQMMESWAKVVQAQATLVTAYAGANKTNAEAAQAWEQARGLALDNEVKYAKTFYDKKALYRADKALAQGPKTRTAEDYLRIARAGAPQRLAEDQLNGLNGAIAWPSLLMSEEFEPERTRLNELFEKRLDYPQDSQVVKDVKQAVEEIGGKLLQMVRNSDQTEYAKSKKFLRSLAFESQLPTSASKVAAN